MSISRQLIHLMRGVLDFTSPKDKGSTFFFELTFNKATQNITSLAVAQNYNPEYLYAKRIVLAEDNKVNQLLMKSIMDETSAHFEIVDNGQIAIEKYLTNKYDLILMDINMPVKNSVEAFHEIQKHIQDGGHTVPMIAITVNALVGDRESYIQNGMSDCITKPINVAELYQMFERFLSCQG